MLYLSMGPNLVVGMEDSTNGALKDPDLANSRPYDPRAARRDGLSCVYDPGPSRRLEYEILHSQIDQELTY